MNPDRDDDLLRRYREASEAVNERPDASARASILAAAAREVRAGPISAQTVSSKFRRRSRWPLAAAAAVMLSTLAVMLAIRTEEEMPRFESPPEPARSAAKQAAPMAPPVPSVTGPSQSQEAVRDQAAPETRKPSVPRERPAAPARREGDNFALSKEEKAPAPAEAPVPASPQPLLESAPHSKPKKDPAEAGAAAQARPLDQTGSELRRDAARGAASAQAPAVQSDRAEAESAATALERIIKLRREGRHDEADEELKRFRERYPLVQLPVEALPPMGTR